MQGHITAPLLAEYGAALRRTERAAGTVAKYIRDLTALARYLDGGAMTGESVGRWRDSLIARGYAPVTVNSMLAAANGFFRFMGWGEKVKFLKIQRRVFRDPARELTRSDYDRLLAAAQRQGRERLALLAETLCATGVRVSEVCFITAEAAKAGRATVALKGKIRTILLPGKLCRKLLQYARKQKIASGPIFRTGSGRSMTRRQIWAELKSLSAPAGVAASKVFPHNFRHLFATIFYRASRDIVELADILGHSSIETTRIYLTTSGAEHRRRLDRLGLVQ